MDLSARYLPQNQVTLSRTCPIPIALKSLICPSSIISLHFATATPPAALSGQVDTPPRPHQKPGYTHLGRGVSLHFALERGCEDANSPRPPEPGMVRPLFGRNWSVRAQPHVTQPKSLLQCPAPKARPGSGQIPSRKGSCTPLKNRQIPRGQIPQETGRTPVQTGHLESAPLKTAETSQETDQITPRNRPTSHPQPSRNRSNSP